MKVNKLKKCSKNDAKVLAHARVIIKISPKYPQNNIQKMAILEKFTKSSQLFCKKCVIINLTLEENTEVRIGYVFLISLLTFWCYS